MGSILEIIAKLLGLTDFLVRRKAAKNDDPRNQSEKQKDENREAIADGTGGDILMHRLNRLPDDPAKGSRPKQ